MIVVQFSASAHAIPSFMIKSLIFQHRTRKKFATTMGVLTKSESDLIVESWALATPDMEKHGTAIFIK